MGVFSRYKGILHLEVATAGAAQPGDMPGIINGDLLEGEVTADWRFTVVAAILTAASPINRVAWLDPLPNGQRPVTR